jgi:hypothetical protein
MRDGPLAISTDLDLPFPEGKAIKAEPSETRPIGKSFIMGL